MNPVKWYYSNFNVQYYFLHYLKNREMAFLTGKSRESRNCVPMRNMRVHNIQSLQFYFNFLRAFEEGKFYNLYYSLAEFKNGVPFRDLTGNNFEKDRLNKWNEEAYKDIIAYDMLIDIDSGSFEEFNFAMLSAELLKKFFDTNNVPYHLRFSGMGFHFIIPDKYFKYLNLSYNPNEDKNIYRYMSDVATWLNKNISELIDLSVYDSRRVCKIPYSLSFYQDKTFICQPIHDLNSFDLKEMSLTKGLNLRSDKLFNPEGNIKLFDDLIK